MSAGEPVCDGVTQSIRGLSCTGLNSWWGLKWSEGEGLDPAGSLKAEPHFNEATGVCCLFLSLCAGEWTPVLHIFESLIANHHWHVAALTTAAAADRGCSEACFLKFVFWDKLQGVLYFLFDNVTQANFKYIWVSSFRLEILALRKVVPLVSSCV